MRTTSRLIAAAAAACLMTLAGGTPALAHEERESTFPDGTGTTPVARAYDPAGQNLVVCKKAGDESAAKIAAMPAGPVKTWNEALLAECEYEHIQAAVDAVTTQGSNIYVLPGVYREEPSWNPPCAEGYDGGVVDYAQIQSCGEVLNLVTIAGDTDPATREVECGPLCDLQVEGTGTRMEDVVLRGGFDEDGDWIKHNGMKADRADGIIVRNMSFELFRENALYVHETDGYLLDEVNARYNDLYGILTFASDHGVISNCDTSYNGDSGIYPGSAADVNNESTTTGSLDRYSVEIFGCRTHHNALGVSGTAANSVWFHDNSVDHNQAGYVTDSFVGGHPGMPQDHAWLENNRIFANNNNYVAEFVHSGVCAKKPSERGHDKGTVCPVFPVPVGTGVLIAGGNYNFVDQNQIFDNWRAGVKLLWVPGAIRGDLGVLDQLDTSNGNHFTANSLGAHPDGFVQPNGYDFEWDEQGVGNCWSDNTSSTGEVTSDLTIYPELPACPEGSLSSAGNAAKTAQMAPCATYHREDEPDPVGCDWFDNPVEPPGRQAAPGDEAFVGRGDGGGTTQAAPPAGSGLPRVDAAPVAARSLPTTGVAFVPALAGLVLAGTVLHLRRRTRAVR